MAENNLRKQAQYSKKSIIMALVRLMESNEFNLITVKEIYYEAGVSKQTFYRHFHSKENVLQEYFNQVTNELFDKISVLEEKNVFNLFVIYFQFWKFYKALVKTIYSSVGQFIIVSEYEKAIKSSFSLIDMGSIIDKEKLTYAEDFIMGGIFHMKKRWIENEFKETPEELANQIIMIIENILL